MRIRSSCVALVLVLSSSPAFAEEPAPPAPSQTGGEVLEGARLEAEGLHEEIVLLNLLNGLNLSPSQYLALEACAREADEARLQARGAGALSAEQTLESLRSLRDALLHGPEGVTPEIGRAFRESKDRGEELRERLAETLTQLAARVSATLTPAQLEVVHTFKPCSLPPRDQRDPVRAGQASQNPRLVNALRRVRAMPEPQYQRRREATVDRWLTGWEEHHQRLGAAERAKERERLLALTDRVRAMPEVEFELQKNELAEETQVQDKLAELRHEMASVQRERGSGAELVRRYFLSPVSARALHAKVAAIAAAPSLVPADLDTVPAAPTCEDGGCATSSETP